MSVRSSTPFRTLTALIACCALVAAAVLATAGPAAPAPKVGKRHLIFGGHIAVQFDPALLTAYGIVLEPHRSAKPSPTGLRFKIHDGRTTLRYLPVGLIQSVGTTALVQGANKLSLHWFDARFGKKSVLSSRVGVNSGWGPRATLFRLTPSDAGYTVDGQKITHTNLPLTLTAVGAAQLNALFVAPGQPPFAIGQQVGVVSIKTRWYN
jgi:hypothetical protein